MAPSFNQTKGIQAIGQITSLAVNRKANSTAKSFGMELDSQRQSAGTNRSTKSAGASKGNDAGVVPYESNRMDRKVAEAINTAIDRAKGGDLPQTMDVGDVEKLAKEIVGVLEGNGLELQAEDIDELVKNIMELLGAQLMMPNLTPEQLIDNVMARMPEILPEGAVDNQNVVGALKDLLTQNLCPLEKTNDAAMNQQPAMGDEPLVVMPRELGPQLSEITDKPVDQVDRSAQKGTDQTAANMETANTQSVQTEETSRPDTKGQNQQQQSREGTASAQALPTQHPLVNAFNSVLAPQAPPSVEVISNPAPVSAGSILTQIVESIATSGKEGEQQFVLALKPEFLGGLSIELSMGETGLRARLTTADFAVRNMVFNQMQELKTTLAEKGISVSEMEVIYDNMRDDLHHSQTNDGQQQGSGGRRRYRLSMDGEGASAIGGAHGYDVYVEVEDFNANGSVEYKA